MRAIGILFSLGFIFQFAFLFFGVLLGLCTFGVNTRYLYAVTPTSHLVRFLFFFFSIHAVFVWPITQFVSREIEGIRSCTLRRSVFTALVSVPLLAFGYYLGTFRSPLDYFELVILVLPSVIIGVHLFEESEKSWRLSLFLALTIYTGFFLVGDLLGPFVTLFRYAPQGESFVLFRALGPVLSVLLFCLRVKFSKRVLLEETHALLLLTLISGVGLAFEQFKIFYWAVLFPILFFVLRIRSWVSYQMALGICAVAILGISMETCLLFVRKTADFSISIWACLACLSLGSLFSLVVKLRSKNLQLFFLPTAAPSS